MDTAKPPLFPTAPFVGANCIAFSNGDSFVLLSDSALVKGRVLETSAAQDFSSQPSRSHSNREARAIACDTTMELHLMQLFDSVLVRNCFRDMSQNLRFLFKFPFLLFNQTIVRQ